MLIVKKLINKSQLFDLFNDKQIESFKVIKQRNKNLKNPLLCQVEVNYILSVNEINTILGCIEKHLTNVTFCQSEKGFLKSLLLMKYHFSIKRSHMLSLIEIGQEYKIDFSIPKRIKKILDEYQYGYNDERN